MAASIKLEVDGKPIEVPPGTMVMEAANRLGLYVPHFCYHKKLSIAANCRMCLVEIEKAPKPLPACATPVTEGMKVHTHSAKAKQAQNSVMEFLLINHPLDCPICDQGGECQLQDLAVGYGGSASRYDEPKRVVLSKELGPLVAAEEMSRCIQCTRCIRFGQEIAGLMELGMVGRGEHEEIVSFVGKTVDSELSGNMIDICPVGALTSKPFRYSARTWELSRRKSVSPHDSFGSNLIVQVKLDKVLRVLPLENEELNECWLSDRDRFSYEGLNAPDRLTRPMLRDGATWRETDWEAALAYTVKGLRQVVAAHGGDALGALAAPHSTMEELYLLQHLVRALGSDNVDFRLRQSDFRADAAREGAPWLGMKFGDLAQLDRVLVIGSFLRKDHPLIAQRLRQAAKKGQQVCLLSVAGDDPLLKLAHTQIVAPSGLAGALAELVRAVAESAQKPVPAEAAQATVSEPAKALAAILAGGKNIGLFLGNAAAQHPQAALLHLLVQRLAGLLEARFGFLGEAANSVGGYRARAVPGAHGRNAAAMLREPRKAYLLLNVEPALDCYNPAQAARALGAAEFVVSMSSYAPGPAERADVVLPVAPFTETAGSYTNAEGRLQTFNACAHPLGECRPAWKVLRVIGSMLGLADFEFNSSEQVLARVGAGDGAVALDNRLNGVDLRAAPGTAPAGAVERLADVPIYFSDSIVRRAPALQKTRDAAAPRLYACAATLQKLALIPGARARVVQDDGEAVLDVAADEGIPAGCVRIAAGHALTARLGGMFDLLKVVPA
jgi:NADH-quinone oxidoreductase subunit G